VSDVKKKGQKKKRKAGRQK